MASAADTPAATMCQSSGQQRYMKSKVHAAIAACAVRARRHAFLRQTCIVSDGARTWGCGWVGAGCGRAHLVEIESCLLRSCRQLMKSPAVRKKPRIASARRRYGAETIA